MAGLSAIRVGFSRLDSSGAVAGGKSAGGTAPRWRIAGGIGLFSGSQGMRAETGSYGGTATL